MRIVTRKQSRVKAENDGDTFLSGSFEIVENKFTGKIGHVTVHRVGNFNVQIDRQELITLYEFLVHSEENFKPINGE